MKTQVYDLNYFQKLFTLEKTDKLLWSLLFLLHVSKIDSIVSLIYFYTKCIHIYNIIWKRRFQRSDKLNKFYTKHIVKDNSFKWRRMLCFSYSLLGKRCNSNGAYCNVCYLNIPTASNYRTPRQTLGEVSHLYSDAGSEELM